MILVRYAGEGIEYIVNLRPELLGRYKVNAGYLWWKNGQTITAKCMPESVLDSKKLCGQVDCSVKPNTVYCSTFAGILRECDMANTKTATLTIRLDPGLKDALRAAAQVEHRSIANMIEMLIREHCVKNDIAIEQSKKSDQRGER